MAHGKDDDASKLNNERLSGQVERVTFHSEESGFGVLQVKVRGFRDLVTVVGSAPSVSPGAFLDASGSWVVDSRHGQQFKAKELRLSQPDTAEGMEKYLGSGMVRGIGPHFAKKLIHAFGKAVFKVIEGEPRRLLQVEGIGKVRQERIVRAWREQEAVREIMVFLHSHGVSTSRAFRIYKTYGGEAVEKVREDPYRLARDIRGIGFKTADQVAERLGVPRDSDLRARAGVEFALQEITEKGHCAFPRAGLEESAAKLLEIPGDVVRRAVDAAVASGRLSQSPGPRGESLLYLTALDVAERLLAKNLVLLAQGPHPLGPVDAPKAAVWAESKVGLALAPHQREALAAALTCKVLVVTGGPGVGKTTLVKAILQVFLAKNLRIALCSPTGRAAKRLCEATGLDASTVHRLLEFDPATGGFKRDGASPLKGDLFVVDESSMLDLVLAHQLVRAVPHRAALLFVGDADQLPSVGPGNVLRDLIACGAIPVCRLTEVFRQAAQSAIIRGAHRVNSGQAPLFPKDREEPSDFYFVEAEEPEKGAALVLKLVRDSIPRRFGLDPVRDIQVLCPMQRGELGARNLNLLLQEALNGVGLAMQRFGWTYRAGDKVMQTVNDYDKEVFNGDLGTVAHLETDAQELVVRFDGRDVAYAFGELDALVPAYAFTVHKAQGSEYPAVVVPVHTQHYPMLQRNMLYTAITRAKKLAVLVGTRKALAMAVRRAEGTRRITTLQERLRDAFAAPPPATLPLAAEAPARYEP
jgi:exodeoxyribonuclease V alpha subunit